MCEAMRDTTSGSPQALDEATLAFAQGVFGYARSGDTVDLGGLLAAGLPPNLTNDKGDTLLMLASYHRQGEAVRLLLSHGADPERANDRGQTPLGVAAYQGDLATVLLLLDHGADVNGCGQGGRTALMTAAMFERTAIVDLLLARGADLDACDADGLTAAAAARIMGAEIMAERLDRLAQASRFRSGA